MVHDLVKLTRFKTEHLADGSHSALSSAKDTTEVWHVAGATAPSP